MQAWCVFRAGKRPSWAIDDFSYYLEQNIAEMTAEINNRTYRHGGYQHISVSDKKRRDLAVATVRDRVIHRYVYDKLVSCSDKSLDPDVWSCRRGKGLHGALDRTQKLLARYADDYVWRADITKFFDHVRHDVLERELARRLGRETELFWLAKEIVESYDILQTDRQTDNLCGIPIGNLTSQIFSNIYLNLFDRYVRHELKPLAYLRYGDDFILITPTRRQARHCQQVATELLYRSLGLRINPRSNVVVSTASGLHFLGHAVTAGYAVVDKHTSRSVLSKANLNNLASYQSLPLARQVKRELYWRVFDKAGEILDSVA